MIKKILGTLLVVVIGILGMAAMKPDTFSVVRSTTIKAPPEKVLALVSDFHQWPSWSPWEKLDPNMQRSFSGAPAGKGAVYAWTGNSDVGRGRMEIVDVAPGSRVVVRLEFVEPIASTNTTEFTASPTAEGTSLSWTMTGPMPFLTKVVSVFMSMDSMVGRDFEKGLAQLKAAAEK